MQNRIPGSHQVQMILQVTSSSTLKLQSLKFMNHKSKSTNFTQVSCNEFQKEMETIT